MEWLARKGAHIYVPVGHSPDVDFIAKLGSRLLRIEVKSSTYRNGIGRWEVTIATRGGNQSWSGVVKRFDPDRCDYLFVVTGDGRRWFLPTGELECTAGLSLGGPKYAEFEVDPGRPLTAAIEDPGLQSSARPGEYPSGQRMATVNRPAQPSQVRILPPPSVAPETPDPRPAVGRTRMSSNHQVSVPIAVAAAAEVSPGDRFRAESDGRGRFVMTRIEEYAARHAAQLTLDRDDGETTVD
jgi:hypothetical protein